ncbi:Importin repeat, putative [Leishmania lindenbergi]|uniref:Importin repeat n=1 Tax=Leishmania lindenbergi TaxID=651832 RepID=A0AAW2ZZD2_9TRYP
MDSSHFIVVLNGLRSADNQERKSAEEHYNNMVASNPVWMMCTLAEASATSQDTGVKTISLVLLRKLFNATPSPYAASDAATRAAVKAHMLSVINSSSQGGLRSPAAACVSALAVQVFQEKEDWNELWTNVMTILGDIKGDEILKTMCCEIVQATSMAMAAYFQSHADTLAQGLETCFVQATDTADLKKAAFETTIRLSNLGMADRLRPLVPKMLGVIEAYLNQGEWESVESMLEATVDGISSSISLFQHDAENLLGLMMQVAAAPQVDAGARHMAVELMLTYCEEVPKTVRKVPQFASSFFELLFQYTLNPDYGADWDITGRDKDEDDLEENSDLVIGSSGLDRISNALGGRKLQKTAQALFTQNINSSLWQHRNAAVLLICYAGEGMRTVFASQLPSLVQMIVPHVKDESKYVRANTLDCLAQLSQDFTPELQMKVHGAILPAVVAALRDDVSRVATCAANCLDSFIDSVTGDEEEDDDEDGLDEFRAILHPYIELMCGDCLAMIRGTQHYFVREAALGVLSSVSSTCKSMLLPYVEELVPVYQEMLSLPDAPEAMKTKCKAIECVTLLACGVGRDAFAKYAHDVCNYLRQLCAGGLTNDDPRTRFVMRGWTCMVECLKDQAQPYLSTVIPILLNMMSMECDMEIANVGVGEGGGDEDLPDGVEKMRFVIPGVGERVVTIHTSLIEDKELASNVVFAMLKDLGVGLAPYFHDIAIAAIGQLTFIAGEAIRESGASMLDEILKCYEEMKDPAAQQLAEVALPKLMEALGEESENSVMEMILRAIGRCVSVHPAIMSPTNTALVCDKVMAALEVVVKRRNECLEKRATENDEDELDALEVEDEEVQATISSICDLIGTLLAASKEVFAEPFLAKAFPVLGEWLQSSTDEFYMTRAASILCDFVTHAPQSIIPSLPQICTSSLTIASSSSDDALLQSDFYLMNVIVQLLGSHPTTNMVVNGGEYAVHVQQVTDKYFASNLVNEEEYTHCTCNAISLYVSLLNFFGTTALQQVATAMLTVVGKALPAKDDEVEARRIHDVVLEWVTNHHPVLQALPGSETGFLTCVKAAGPSCLSEEAKQYLANM